MTWYEDTKSFHSTAALPNAFQALAGPHGPALVDVFAEGRTTRGWGLEAREGRRGFMENYQRNEFWSKPRLLDFAKRQQPFAIVMRSVNIVALDIDRHMDDGGADGFVAAAKLGLPQTLAQTSKSGEGRHLFYRTHHAWHPDKGFGLWDDMIGLLPGIDIRNVGCIYHYPQQRWNTLLLAEIPENLMDLMDQRRSKKTATKTLLAAAAAAAPDDEEALIMHDSLLQELNKPIDAGKRNNTLFAIGSQMKAAAYPNWEAEVERRANEVGLDAPEITKLIHNIERYGS